MINQTNNILAIFTNKVTLVITFAMSFFVSLFEKYLFNDWQFAAFLMVLVVLDTTLSVYKHYKSKTISSTGFSKLFTKFIVYASVLILVHVVISFEIKQSVNIVFQWFDDLMYSGIVVREAISILENIGSINPDLIPKWILLRLKAFDDNGNLNQLINNDDKPTT